MLLDDDLDPSFNAEHANLNTIIMRMMECADIPQIIDRLEELEQTLVKHLRHEESPIGPLSFLRRNELVPHVVERFREEHRKFLHHVPSLRVWAQSLLTDDLCGDHRADDLHRLRSAVLDFTAELLAHEHHETQVCLSAMNLLATRKQCHQVQHAVRQG